MEAGGAAGIQCPFQPPRAAVAPARGSSRRLCRRRASRARRNRHGRMRVAVTGGAGYIGSVVAELLLREGHDISIIDNLVKGHRDALPAGVPFAELDLADRSGVASHLRQFRCDAVIHLAAHSLVGESVIDPAKYYANNV